MFKKLLLSVLLVSFFACKSSKKVVTESKKSVETFKITETEKLDTTIVIPGEKVSISIPFSALKIDTSSLKLPNPKVFTKSSGRSTVTVKIDGKGITATSNCDSISQQLNFYKVKVKEMSKLVSENKAKEETKKGYSFLQLLFYITVVAIVSFAAGYLIKTFKNI